MKTFKITFLTLEGNTQQIFIDARTKERALLKFESEYMFESIKYCVEI